MSEAKLHKLAVWQTTNIITITALKCLQLAITTDQAQPSTMTMFCNECLYLLKKMD